MSFTVGGTHPVSFQGGTFNNVAGDMRIVSTVSGSAHHPPLPQRIDHHPYHAGRLKTRRDVRYRDQRPYNRSQSGSHIDNYDKGLPLVGVHSNSTFNTVGGNMNVNLTSYGENGLDVLYRSVLKNAMHNSADRPAEPCCHPGTRDSVLDSLRTWSQDGARLLWLHGCAGMGKSAIAQTFAANCEAEGILGASFFFKRDHPERGNWQGLFPTLAYQLAASFPELSDPLRQAVERDRLVFGQAMQHQFRKLIVALFERTPPLAVRPILVIDGLDECGDHGAQLMILKLIIEALQIGAFPLRVLIISRPEPHLREVLQAAANFNVCRHLELCPDTSAYEDVHRYLCDEFSRLRECHASRGITLDTSWPGEDAINHLVEKSSGTFIYAVTVVRYVDDEYSHPVERLDSVLALDPDSTAPLDNLYTQILSTVSNRSILRRVLHVVVKIHRWDPEEIDLVLQLRAGTSRLVLRGLHSLLSVPPVRTIGLRYTVELLHASLGDFLHDPARSSNLCIGTPELDFALVGTMSTFLSSAPHDTFIFQLIAASLPSCIVRLSPAHNLLPILYDVGVQDVVCWDSQERSREIVEWVKNCVPLPLDLVQIWQDLSYLSRLQHSRESDDPSLDTTGTEYDETYTQSGPAPRRTQLHGEKHWTSSV
ncbi:hypothetical protein DFH06DRAFT_1326417 [Mycena polygramma]|nr:hypothetical protein DFH06DRAFT_1326417 [Mycena polygramma]